MSIAKAILAIAIALSFQNTNLAEKEAQEGRYPTRQEGTERSRDDPFLPALKVRSAKAPAFVPRKPPASSPYRRA